MSSHPKKKTGESPEPVEREMSMLMSVAYCICFLLCSLSGAALLVVWSLYFHPSNRQLWMVPVGLIMTGTPVIVSFSLFASDALRLVELMLQPQSRHPAEPPVLDLESNSRNLD